MRFTSLRSAILQSNEITQDEERPRSEDEEQGAVLLGEDLEGEDRAATEELTDEAQQRQREVSRGQYPRRRVRCGVRPA